MEQADDVIFTNIIEQAITSSMFVKDKFGIQQPVPSSINMHVEYGVEHSAESCVCFCTNDSKTWIIDAITELRCTFIVRFASISSGGGYITCKAKSVSQCKLLVSTYGLLHYLVQNKIVGFSDEKLTELEKNLLDNKLSLLLKALQAVEGISNCSPSLSKFRFRIRTHSLHSYCVPRFKVRSSTPDQEADNESSHTTLNELEDGLEKLNKMIRKVFISAENREETKYLWYLEKLGCQNSVSLAAQYVLLEEVEHTTEPGKKPGSFPSMRVQTAGGDRDTVVVEDRSLEERVKSVDEYQSHSQPNVRFFKDFGNRTHDMLRLMLLHIAMPHETVSRAAQQKDTDRDDETVARVYTFICLVYQLLMKSNHHTGIGVRSFIIPLQIEIGKNLLQSSQRALWEPLLRELFLDTPKVTAKLAVEAIAHSLTLKVFGRFTEWVTQHNKIKYPVFMPWLLTGDNVDIGTTHSIGSHGLHISMCLNLSVKYDAAELAILKEGVPEQVTWPSLDDAEKSFRNVGTHGDQFRQEALVGLYLRALKLLEEWHPREYSTSFWDFDTDSDVSTEVTGDGSGSVNVVSVQQAKWETVNVSKNSKFTFKVDGADAHDVSLEEAHELDDTHDVSLEEHHELNDLEKVVSRFGGALNLHEYYPETSTLEKDEGVDSVYRVDSGSTSVQSGINSAQSGSCNEAQRMNLLDEVESVVSMQEMLDSDNAIDHVFNLGNIEVNLVDIESETPSSTCTSDNSSIFDQETRVSPFDSVTFIRGSELPESEEQPPTFFMIYNIYDVKSSDVVNVNNAIAKVVQETELAHPQKFVAFVSDGQVTSPQLARFISGNNRTFIPILGMTHLFGNVTCQINKQTLGYIENQFHMVDGKVKSHYENWLTKGTLQQRTRSTLARLLSMCMSFLLLLRKHHPSILRDVWNSLRKNDTAVGPKKRLYTFAGDQGTVEISNVSEQLFENVVEVAKHVENLANETIVIDPPSNDTNPLVKVSIIRSESLEFHLQEEDVSAGRPVLRFGKCADFSWRPTTANSWLTKGSVSFGKTRHSFKNGDRIFCYRESTDAEWISIDSKDDAYKFRDDFCSNDELEVIVLPHFAGKTCKRKQFKLLYDTFESLLPILGLYTVVRHPFEGQEYLTCAEPISFDVTNQCPVGTEKDSCQCLTQFPMLYWLYELTKAIQPFNNYNYQKLILMFLISMTQVLSLPELPRSAILKYVLGNMSLSSKWGSNTCVGVDGWQEFLAVQQIKAVAMKRVDVTSKTVAILSKVRSSERSFKSVQNFQQKKPKPDGFHNENQQTLFDHLKGMFPLVDRSYNIVAGAPNEYQLPQVVTTVNSEKGTVTVLNYSKRELDTFVNQRTSAVNAKSLMTHLEHLTERNGLALFLNQPKTTRYPTGFVRVQSLLAQVAAPSPQRNASSPFEKLQQGMQLRRDYIDGTGVKVQLRSDRAMKAKKAPKSCFFQVLRNHSYKLQVVDSLSSGGRGEFINDFGKKMQQGVQQNWRDLPNLMDDTLTKLAKKQLEVTIDHSGRHVTNADFQQVLEKCSDTPEPATLVVVDAIRFLYKLPYPTDVRRIAKVLLKRFARIASTYACNGSAPAFISMLFDIAEYNTLARVNVDLVRHSTVSNSDSQQTYSSTGESLTIDTEIHNMGHLMTIMRDKNGLRNEFFVHLFEAIRISLKHPSDLNLTKDQLFALSSVVIAGGFPNSSNNTPVLSLGRLLENLEGHYNMYELRESLVKDVLLQAEGERQADRLVEICLAHVSQNQPNDLFKLGGLQNQTGIAVVYDVVDVDAKVCTASSWVIMKQYNETESPISVTFLLNNAADSTDNYSEYINMSRLWQLWNDFPFLPNEEVGGRVLSIAALLALVGSDHVEKLPLISYQSVLDQITEKFRKQYAVMISSALQQNCVVSSNDPQKIVPASWKSCIRVAYHDSFSDGVMQSFQFHTSSLIWYKATKNDRGFSFELMINYNFILMLYAKVWHRAKWATATVPIEITTRDNQETCGFDFSKIGLAHQQRAKGSQQLIPYADQLIMRLLRVRCQLTLFFAFPRHPNPVERYRHFFEENKGFLVGLTEDYSQYAHCLPGCVNLWEHFSKKVPSSLLDLEEQQPNLFEALRKGFPQEFLDASVDRSNPLFYLACRIWRQRLAPQNICYGNSLKMKMKHVVALMGCCISVSVSPTEMAYSWDAIHGKNTFVGGAQLCLKNVSHTGIQCVEAVKVAIRTFLCISSIRGATSFNHLSLKMCKLSDEVTRKKCLSWEVAQQCASVTMNRIQDGNFMRQWLSEACNVFMPNCATASEEAHWENILNIKMNEIFKMIVAGNEHAKELAGCFIEIAAGIAICNANDAVNTSDPRSARLKGNRSKRAMDFQGDTLKKPNTSETPDRMKNSSGIIGSTGENLTVQQCLDFS